MEIRLSQMQYHRTNEEKYKRANRYMQYRYLMIKFPLFTQTTMHAVQMHMCISRRFFFLFAHSLRFHCV